MTHGLPDLVFTAAYLLIGLVAGYAAVSAAVGPAVRHWAEVAGLSAAAGAGLTSLWLMVASLAGFPPTRGVLAAWAAVAAVATAAVLWRGRLVRATVPGRRSRPDGYTAVGLLAAAALIAAVGNVWTVTNTPGLADIDEYATWMLKAKVVARVPLRPVPAALLDPGLSYSHQDYPLLLPLLSAGAAAAVGRFDESAAKSVLLPMYLALAGLVYAAARRDDRRAVAVAITALVVAAPVVVQKAGLAVGELPVTLFLAAAVSMLARWADGGGRGDLLLAGGFAAAAAFSKNEGLAMLPVFAVAAIAAARRRWADVAAGVVTTTVLLSPWLVYRHWLPRTHEDYGGKFLTAAVLVHGFARLPTVLAGMLGEAVTIGAVGGIWIVLPIVAAIGWRAWRRPVTRVVWGVLVAQLGLYVLAFLVTPWDLSVLLPMVTSKLLAQATPAAAILIALHAAAAGVGVHDRPSHL